MSWQSFDAMDHEDTVGLAAIYQPLALDPANDPAPVWGVIIGNDGWTVKFVALGNPDETIVAPIEDFDLPGTGAILDMTDEQVNIAEYIRARHLLVE